MTDPAPSYSTPPADDAPVNGGLRPTGGAPLRTPAYEAANAARYERQLLLVKIQEKHTKRRLISYISGPSAQIDREDVLGFADLLHTVPPGAAVDLMLHTLGGDIDAAQMLVEMIRARVLEAPFRIVVPHYAKSAGTLMVLGADEVIMGHTSELGPIDPQIQLRDANGTVIVHSMQNYLDAYEEHTSELRKNPSNVSAQIMLGKLDPATVKLFTGFKERARKCADNFIHRGMLRKKPDLNWTKLIGELLDTKTYPTHGHVITAQEATGMGLVVNRLDAKDPLWVDLWRLFCRQRIGLKDDEKLFESEYVSLIL